MRSWPVNRIRCKRYLDGKIDATELKLLVGISATPWMIKKMNGFMRYTKHTRRVGKSKH